MAGKPNKFTLLLESLSISLSLPFFTVFLLIQITFRLLQDLPNPPCFSRDPKKFPNWNKDVILFLKPKQMIHLILWGLLWFDVNILPQVDLCEYSNQQFVHIVVDPWNCQRVSQRLIELNTGKLTGPFVHKYILSQYYNI